MSLLKLAKSKILSTETRFSMSTISLASKNEANNGILKSSTYYAKNAINAKRVAKSTKLSKTAEWLTYKQKTDHFNHNALQAKGIGIIGESMLPETKGKIILIKFHKDDLSN